MVRLLREIKGIIHFFRGLFPAPLKPRPKRSMTQRYWVRDVWGDEEWDKYRAEVLGKKLP